MYLGAIGGQKIWTNEGIMKEFHDLHPKKVKCTKGMHNFVFLARPNTEKESNF